MRQNVLLFVLFAVSQIFPFGTAQAEAPAGPGKGVYLPAPLVPQLSADGKTMVHGVPLKAVIADPDPAAPRLKIPAPAGLTAEPEAATASFAITYVPAGGADPWLETCYTFPEEAKAAFNAAAAIWANTVTSGVPITISACWADLGSSTTLGYSGGGNLWRDFSGATLAGTWYAESLANSLYGSDLGPGDYDMHITYNKNFVWYYGTDGNTPSGQYDLMSVVLHEIAHGLNFSGSMDYSGGTGSWGYPQYTVPPYTPPYYPNVYDVFMRDGSGNQLINTSVYSNPSTDLGTALTSNDIWFHGSEAMAANSGQRVKMYAPGTWNDGSSYSHFDYNTFNNTSNQLMVWAISDGESIHDPGVIARGLLADLGWTVSSMPPPPPPPPPFPWIMFLPAINSGGVEPAPAVAYWGTDNDVCCTTSSATFYLTLSGVTRTSALASCAGPSSWTGWATATPGAKTFTWEWLSSNCTSYMGNFSYTLQQGIYHLFELGWNGSSFTMVVYTGATPFAAQAIIRSGGSPAADGDGDAWQRADEIVLDIPGESATKPKGILKATN